MKMENSRKDGCNYDVHKNSKKSGENDEDNGGSLWFNWSLLLTRIC